MLKEKVFIPSSTFNSSEYRDYSDWLEDKFIVSTYKNDFMGNPATFSLVLFTGGNDVNPELYGDSYHNRVGIINKQRDEHEAQIYTHALKYKIPMFGICRGLQFLNIMNGGRLLHDVTNHSQLSAHQMYSHKYKYSITVNSLHHQVCVPSKNSFVVGWDRIKPANTIYGNHDREIHWGKCLVEALIFPDTLCAGVQFHPELMSDSSLGHKFAEDLLTDIIKLKSTDITNNWTHKKQYYEAGQAC